MSMLSTSTLLSDYLTGVASDDTASVTTLGRALTRVESLTANELGYPGVNPTLASTSYVQRIQGLSSSPKALLIPLAPVTALASVYQDLDQVFGTDTLIASSDYELEVFANGAYLHLLPRGNTSRWLTAERSIKVSCTAGYADEAAMPAALADALYRWVASWWLRRTSRHLTSQAQGQVTQGLAKLDACPPDVEEILVNFRLLGGCWGVS